MGSLWTGMEQETILGILINWLLDLDCSPYLFEVKWYVNKSPRSLISSLAVVG